MNQRINLASWQMGYGLRFLLSVFLLMVMANGQVYAGSTGDVADKCFKRAERYEKEANRFANDVRDPGKWFDLAMKNYLCAAKAGNSLAKWRAVNLSGSGQVVALPKEIEDRFLMEAAEAGLQEAQIGLATTYCDNVGTRELCKNPIEAEKWLIRAARAGSSWGAFELGIFYERGSAGENTVQLGKALACYKLSFQRYRRAIEVAGEIDIRQLNSELGSVKQGIERLIRKLNGGEIAASCY